MTSIELVEQTGRTLLVQGLVLAGRSKLRQTQSHRTGHHPRHHSHLLHHSKVHHNNLHFLRLHQELELARSIYVQV